VFHELIEVCAGARHCVAAELDTRMQLPHAGTQQTVRRVQLSIGDDAITVVVPRKL